jgi:hypothetical protein
LAHINPKWLPPERNIHEEWERNEKFIGQLEKNKICMGAIGTQMIGSIDVRSQDICKQIITSLIGGD